MFVLDSKRYLKWQTFPTNFRYWIKLWIDGHHGGTHIHWRVSPLALIGLAKIWRHFNSLNRKHSKPQRNAIIRMACRRRDCSIHGNWMPQWGETEQRWNDFFSSLLDSEANDRKNLIDWHEERLTDDRYFVETPLVSHKLSELSGYLFSYGYSTDDLFNRVRDMVIDVQDIQGGPCTERMSVLFERFRSPEPFAKKGVPTKDITLISYRLSLRQRNVISKEI